MKKTNWPKVLTSAKEIAEYIEDQSSDYVCREMIEEFFFDSHAKLEVRQISAITAGYENGNAQCEDKSKRYAQMSKLTRPPIVLNYEGGVADGNHRLRDAIAKGETIILCYVPYEGPYDPKLELKRESEGPGM